jgi:hypothetical protein
MDWHTVGQIVVIWLLLASLVALLVASAIRD